MSTPTLLQIANSPTGAQWINGASSGTIAFGSTTAAKSLFVAFVKQVGSNVALNNVMDDQGNTWVVKPAVANSTISTMQIAYSLLTTGGTASTVTFNFAGAVSVAIGGIAEFSNIQNIRDLTLLASGAGTEVQFGTSTAPLSAIPIPVVGDCIFTVADGGVLNTHTQYTIPAGTTLGSQVQGFVDVDSFAWAYEIATTNAIISPTWTLGVSSAWSALVFSFAPPVPAQLAILTATDPFAGGNQNPLAGNWSTWGSASACKLVSNAVFASTGTGFCGSYWNANNFGDDHFSEITIGAVDVSGVLRGPAVRMSANGGQTNGYIGVMSGTTVIDVQKIVNGTGTILGTAIAKTFTTGDVVRLSACKNLITLSQNGTVVKVFYDPTFISGGAPGLFFNEQGGSIVSSITKWLGGQSNGDSRFYQSSIFGHDDSQTVESGPFTIANVKGSLLVCCSGWPDASEPGMTITDTNANVWVKVIPGNTSPFGQTFFYCLNAKAGANTVSVTRVGAGHNVNTIAEYLNSGGWSLDTSTHNSGTTAAATGTLTTAAANELLIAYIGAAANQIQGVVPGSAYRNAYGGEIKLYDQNALTAGSNTFAAIWGDSSGSTNGATGNQEIFLIAFGAIMSSSGTASTRILFSSALNDLAVI